MIRNALLIFSKQMALSVTIGTEDGPGYKVFRSKEAAREFFTQMLGKYGSGQPVEEADCHFLRALIDLHPDTATKIGAGIESFFVDRDPNWGRNNCFYVRRKDGSGIDFSFKKCLGIA